MSLVRFVIPPSPPSSHLRRCFSPDYYPIPLLIAFVLPFLAFSLDVTNCGSETLCFWHKSGNNYVVSLILSSCSFPVHRKLLSMYIIRYFFTIHVKTCYTISVLKFKLVFRCWSSNQSPHKYLVVNTFS